MIAIDFVGLYLKWSVFEAGNDGRPLHPVTCECLGRNKCPHWHFRPHPKQVRFFDSRSPRLLFGGGRGGGKSEALVWKPVFTAFRVPGCKMICFRRTMGELKKTILQRFLELPKGIWTKCTEDAVTFETGSKLWFGSADDEKAIRKLLSGEYLLVEFDEWSEWPLSMWKFAEGSCRAPQEFDRFGQKIVPQVVGATNPGGVGGATLNALFGCDGKDRRQAPGEDPTLYDATEYEFIQSLVGDNPAYSEDTLAGQQYRKMLASQPRRIQAAWIYGRWDGFEGQYFDCLDESVTRIPHDTYLKWIKKQYWAPRWISIDWGMTHHASVGWHALIQIGNKHWPVTYRSYLTKGLGEVGLAQEIVDMTLQSDAGADKGKIVKIYLSPETFGDTSHSRARRMGDVFSQNDMPRPVAANNSRETGWRLMHDLLRARYENVELLPEVYQTVCGWLITDHRTQPVPQDGDLPTPIECLTQAVCDPKKDGDVLKEGDAVHLDVNDQLRYGIASHISPEERPFDDKLKEELSKIPIEGPNRYIKHLNMLKEEREKDSGVFYVGARPGGRIGRRRR